MRENRSRWFKHVRRRNNENKTVKKIGEIRV